MRMWGWAGVGVVYSRIMAGVHPSISRDTLANSQKTGEHTHPKRRSTLLELCILRVLTSFGHIAMQLYSYTGFIAIQLYGQKATQLYSNIVKQLCYIDIWLYNFIAIQLSSYIAIWLYSNTAISLYSYIAIQPYSYIAMQLHRHIATKAIQL